MDYYRDPPASLIYDDALGLTVQELLRMRDLHEEATELLEGNEGTLEERVDAFEEILYEMGKVLDPPYAT